MSNEDTPALTMLKALCKADPKILDSIQATIKVEALAKYLLEQLTAYSTELRINLFSILKVPIALNNFLIDTVQHASEKAFDEQKSKATYTEETNAKMEKVAEQILKGLENETKEGDGDATKDNS